MACKTPVFLFFFFFGKGVRNWQVVSFQIGNGFFRRIVVGKGLFVWFAGSAAGVCVCVCVCARARARARARVCFGECLILRDKKKKMCKISNSAVIFSLICIAKCVCMSLCAWLMHCTLQNCATPVSWRTSVVTSVPFPGSALSCQPCGTWIIMDVVVCHYNVNHVAAELWWVLKFLLFTNWVW